MMTTEHRLWRKSVLDQIRELIRLGGDESKIKELQQLIQQDNKKNRKMQKHDR